MKVWAIEREEGGWMGALIIVADSEEEALEIFKKYVEDCYEPGEIKELDISKKGVIYNDDPR